MGRWRPPRPESSPYITRAGFEGLELELKELWAKRRVVVKALAAAAAEGDRSENAEYIYRKKELGGLDYRIRYLQKRIPKLNIVDQTPKQEKVFFGAWVLLERADESTVEYRIVGPDEIDGAEEYISMDSPLAKALLRKQLDDEVKLTTSERNEVFLVTGIRYQ
jgi:transcription elongation factor GreB